MSTDDSLVLTNYKPTIVPPKKDAFTDTVLEGMDDGLLPEEPTENDVGMDDGLLPPNEGEYPDKDDDGIPDINIYQHKKTLAQGMMDLALLSANANQLRYVLERGPKHSYYYSSIILISLSLFLQVSVGVGLIWNGKYNINKDKHMHMANRVNNVTVIGIFIITVLNVFISAFGMPGQEEFSPLVESMNLVNISKPLR